MASVEAITAEVAELTRQEAELKASLVLVGVRLKVARQRLEKAVREEAVGRVKEESSSSSSSDSDDAPVPKGEGVVAGGVVKAEPAKEEELKVEGVVAGGEPVVGGAEVKEQEELDGAGGGVGAGVAAGSAGGGGAVGPGPKRPRRLPKRPAGHCLRCWYIHHGVPGGPRHTRDGGCFVG